MTPSDCVLAGAHAVAATGDTLIATIDARLATQEQGA